MIETLLGSNIAVVGGGRICKAILQALSSENFRQKSFIILGVADIDDQAMGLKYAKQLGIFTTNDYRRLFRLKNLDSIIELTKDDDLSGNIRRSVPPGIRFFDHFEARAILDYLQIEGEKTSILRKIRDSQNNIEKIEALFEQFYDFFLKISKERNEYSQRIRTELSARERAISQVVQGSTIPTFVIDKDHIVTHWNKACEKLTGYPADKIVGTNKHWQPFRPEKRPIMADLMLNGMKDYEAWKYYGTKWNKSSLIEGAFEAEEFFHHLGDEGKWLFFTAAPIKSPDGEIVGAIETLWDRTVEKKAEEEQGRHIRELATLCSIYGALNTPLDLSDRINSAIQETNDILEADGICIFLPEDDGDYQPKYNYGCSERLLQTHRVAHENSVFFRVAQSGKLTILEDLEQCDDEEIRSLRIEGLKAAAYVPIIAKGGKTFGIIIVVSKRPEHFALEERHILELLANRIGAAIENSMLQEELQRDAEFQARLIEHSTNGIVATDEKWRIVIFNPEAERIFGYSRDEVIKKLDARTLYSPEIVETIEEKYDKKRINRGVPWKETSIVLRDGKAIPVRFSGTLIHENGMVMGSVAFFQDLREIRRLENELVRSERLAAIGQTVAGTAHDIKNILHGFKGGGYLINVGLDKNDTHKLKNGWQMIQRNISRTSDLVLDLLSYSKEREPEYESCFPNDIVDDVCGLFVEVGRENMIKIHKDFPLPVGEVKMDPRTIHRALSNLISNAIDACIFDDNPDKRHRINITVAPENNNIVRFEVQDNGSGIDEEVRKKLFTTFFSTKGSKGTGLGLLVTKKLVEEHNGTIDVTSQLGKGSTFTVRLPLKSETKNDQIVVQMMLKSGKTLGGDSNGQESACCG
jgi:PAS domain S-box-containing protein